MRDRLGLFAQAEVEEKTYLFYYNPRKDNRAVYVSVDDEIGLSTAGFVLNFTCVEVTKNKYVPVVSMDIGESNCSQEELESIIRNLNVTKEIFFTAQ
jgi:hypothetical protein